MPPKPNLNQLPTLDTGPLPLAGIREQARKQLLEVVDSRRGRKALVLDPALSGPLSLLDTQLTQLLTEHGVAKLLYLDPAKRLDDPAYAASEPRLADVPSLLYLVRPTLANAQAVAAQIKAAPKGSSPGSHDFSLVFVPRRTIACERVLEEEGVLGDVTIGEYGLDMVPYEDDVLSLELDGAFADCVADGDPSPLYATAAAITRLQAMFGVIPRVQGKGPAATAVRDMCFRMRRENPSLGLLAPAAVQSTSAGTAPPRIDRLILIDREVDVVTPLMSQITFEGLLDEVTGIKHGSVPWEPKDKRAGGEGPGGGPKAPGGGRTLLNSTDPFYKEFRDLPFHVAIMRLQQHARDARRDYSELGSKDLSELKSYVKGLHRLAGLDRLSDVAVPPAQRGKDPLFHERLSQEQAIVEGYQPEASVAFIEELMYRGADLVEVLRLAALLSAVGGGLPRRTFDALRQELLHTYGHQHLLTLNTLERAGLLKAASHSGGRSGFSALRKALQLLVPEPEQLDPGQGPPPPSDVSHLYKGYAPISIRLVETALRTGWAPVSEALLHLPGNHFDVLQAVDNSGMPVEKPYKPPPAATPSPAATSTSAASSAGGAAGASAPAAAAGGAGASGSASGQRVETVLVVFIGGVTFSEISALRWLSSRPEWPYRFLVLTTKVVNGRTLLQGFVDPLAVRVGECVGMQG